MAKVVKIMSYRATFEFLLCFPGEFGIVYKGVMTSKKGMPQAVALKTLKGIKRRY